MTIKSLANIKLLILFSVLGCLSSCGGKNSVTDTLEVKNYQAAPINDVPTFNGPRSNYIITKTPAGHLIQDVVGTEESRELVASNRARFDDVTITFTMDQAVAQISSDNYQMLVELYIAFFNRVPDADGLSYWISEVKNGKSIEQIASSFYQAAIKYGDLTGYSQEMSNSDFVKIIYKNVLGRSEVDAEGLNYWSSALSNGTERGTLVKTILNSAHGSKGNTTYGWVADLLDNKFEVGDIFANINGATFNAPEDSIKKGIEIAAMVSPTDIKTAEKYISTLLGNNKSVAPLVANEGSVVNVALGSKIMMDGSANLIAPGKSLSYSWTFVSKPNNSLATLSSSSLAKPIFTADVIGEFAINLSVSGSDGYNKTFPINVSVSKTVISKKSTVSVGRLHACAIQTSGGVKCWGYNMEGVLGDNTNVTSFSPVQVNSIKDAVSIAAGSNHSCTVLSNKELKCWGGNAFGALGDGTTIRRYSPVSVLGISNVNSVAVGLYHSCAITGIGSVQCWGYGYDGQLGNGEKKDSSIPVAVSGIENAIAIAAGQWHSCALLRNGSVKCWGKWFNGISADETKYSNPVVINGIQNAIAISLGNAHSCALLSNGKVQCWGNNAYGQLGVAGIPPYESAIPVTIENIDSVVLVAAGMDSTCVVRNTGLVQCWGYGTNNDPIKLANHLPVTIDALKDPILLSLSQQDASYMCAMFEGKRIKCVDTGNQMTADLD